MDDFQQYPPGLLSALGINPENLRRQQQQAGLLSAGLQLLAGSGYSPVRQSTGQLLGQAGMAGVQGMQQAGESAIERALKGLQAQELVRKQQEAQQLRSLLPQVFQVTQTPEKREVFPTETGDYERVTPGGVSNVRIDPAKLQALMMIPGGAEAVRGLAETQKLVRQAGLGVGGAEITSPFASYFAAQNPEVRKLAETYDRGFKTGTITEEDAYKRIEALGRLEDSFIARVESATDRRIAREEAKEERRITREKDAKPTADEKKAGTLAGRLEQALSDLTKIEQEKPEALKPEITPSLLQQGIFSYFPGAEMLAGKISSADRLRAEAAQLDALDAALTLGTGAAYTREQLRGYARAYFPQIGDTPQVIEEKNARFANIVRLARLQSGTAYAGPSPQSITPTLDSVNKNYGLEGRRK
jgi:hypothetical protein